ncbi:hypothetical protein [Stutzerimonas kunmingensis]|uniref:hypothetical protein n=1 Tax=Stutzerimonas kunmingensis TaxID=1211807 RepID=UPI0015E48666|nr:hypothetical protein [Stutzerimonas kunmingensis]
MMGQLPGGQQRLFYSFDSVEKVGSAAAGRSDVPAVEVAGSHFKLPFGVSLSFLAQV